MDSHIRVYIEANWNALGCLPPIAYKVLISLCQRADMLGRCFPSAERIADDCGCHVDSVWASLKTLEDGRYIGYLRRNEQDPITGRWMPNVYMVNPHFICIALEAQESAMKLWSSVYSNHPMPLSEKTGTNQQQEPAPETNTKEPKTRNNNNNQHSLESVGAGEAPQNQKAPDSKKQKAKSEPPKNPNNSDDSQNQQSEASQRSKKRGSSAASYRNPDPIAAPIPDDALERLANRVNGLGVPIPLARGFVVAYGGEICEQALLQLQATKSKGQEIKNEGGFFRHLLQNNLIDKSLPEILTRPKTRSSWADLAEVDYE
jgi:Helix-turn-helix domain